MCERKLVAKVSVTNNLHQRKIVHGNQALMVSEMCNYYWYTASWKLAQKVTTIILSHHMTYCSFIEHKLKVPTRCDRFVFKVHVPST